MTERVLGNVVVTSDKSIRRLLVRLQYGRVKASITVEAEGADPEHDVELAIDRATLFRLGQVLQEAAVSPSALSWPTNHS